MQDVLEEVIEKALTLSVDERNKLIECLKETKINDQQTSGEGFVSPNTIWVKEHHAEYAGKHVALKDGELIAYGNTIKEADLKAKEKGVKNPLLTYIPGDDEEVFCRSLLLA